MFEQNEQKSNICAKVKYLTHSQLAHPIIQICSLIFSVLNSGFRRFSKYNLR